MKKKYIFSILLFLYASLVFFGLSHHEPWRDEAHAWVHARDNSIVGIIGDIPNEGVPILWFLILVPFAKLGFPYETMKLIHGGLAIGAVGLLLFFGELPLVLKIAFMFSYFMAYEYAVVSRNYTITILLLFAIAAFYKYRFKKPIGYGILVGLLFQTNLHSVGPAAGLTGLYLLELVKQNMVTVKRILVVFFMGLVGLVTVVMLLAGPAPGAISSKAGNTMRIYDLVMRSSIVPILPTFNPFSSFPALDTLIVIATYVMIFSLCVYVSKNKTILFLASLSIGWILFINVFVNPAFLRHRGLLLISLIATLIVANTTIPFVSGYRKVAKTVGTVLLSGLLLLSWVYTSVVYIREYRYPFSGASDMARYIQTNKLEGVTTATFVSSFAEPVHAYFSGKKYWYPETGAFDYTDLAGLAYYAAFEKTSVSGAIGKAQHAFPGDTPLLLLLSMPMPYPESQNFTLLHTSNAAFFWGQPTENLWLYSRK